MARTRQRRPGRPKSARFVELSSPCFGLGPEMLTRSLGNGPHKGNRVHPPPGAAKQADCAGAPRTLAATPSVRAAAERDGPASLYHADLQQDPVRSTRLLLDASRPHFTRQHLTRHSTPTYLRRYSFCTYLSFPHFSSFLDHSDYFLPFYIAWEKKKKKEWTQDQQNLGFP